MCIDLVGAWNPYRSQLAGTVKIRQVQRVTAVCLHPVTRLARN